MAETIKMKRVSYGTVETQQNGTQYLLVVNGDIKQYSSSLDYILNEFNKMN